MNAYVRQKKFQEKFVYSWPTKSQFFNQFEVYLAATTNFIYVV